MPTSTHEQAVSDKPQPKRERGRPSSDAPAFPHDSLSRALKLAEAIEKNNAGKPFDRIDLATSVNMSPNSGAFRQLIVSSARYGLTIGGYQADKISLSPVGSAIVAPVASTDVGSSMRQALLKPDLFSRVYSFFDKKAMPRQDVFRNTLKKEFNVAAEDVDKCYDIIMQNVRDYNLSQEVKGGNVFLKLDKLGSALTQIERDSSEIVQQDSEENATEPQSELPQIPTAQAPPAQEQVVKVPRVFISHSKNKKILDNVKQMLSFGKFDYRVAEEKETLSIPLSDKVFGLMQECNCAIINISADQEKKHDDGYAINENVLIEIGAAFLHYNKRVLLVIDERFKEELPSILQGITAIFYEGQELSLSDGMKLMQALGEFRNKL